MKQIINGHIKELFNQERELYEKRMKICNDCALKVDDKILGPVCSKHKWVNFMTGEVSPVQKDKFYNGCGCRLKAKLRIPEASCPNNKW